MNDLFPALCVCAAFFIFGTWYGLYLNLTHLHRMRLWACKVADVVDQVKERAS